MKNILTLLFCLSGSILFAQNYENICSPGTTLFRGSSGSIKAFRQDSVYPQANQDTIFISYRTIRPFQINGCYDTTNGSILGRRIYESVDGNFYFFNWNHDSLTIKTQAALNGSWKFCNLSGGSKIEATVINILNDTILGQSDSVKLILFQAKDMNGNNISHFLNQKTLALSRHYGISMTYDLYYMPDIAGNDAQIYYLFGKSDPVIGAQNLTWKDIYNFDVGDEFQWSGYWQGTTGPTWKTMKRVLAKEVFGMDSVKYTMEYCNIMYLPYAPPETTHDTIIESYNFLTMGASIQNLPQIFFSGGYYRSPGYDRWLASNGRQTQKSVSWSYSRSQGHCWGDPFEPSYSEYQHTEGLGQTFNYHVEWQNWPVINTEEMVYYKKGTEIWGTPLAQNCSELVPVAEKEKPLLPEIHTNPNPVETQAEITLNGIKLDNLHYLLINELGQKVRIREIDSNPYLFDRTGLPEGLFIINILNKKNEVLAKGKIILR